MTCVSCRRISNICFLKQTVKGRCKDKLEGRHTQNRDHKNEEQAAEEQAGDAHHPCRQSSEAVG